MTWRLVGIYLAILAIGWYLKDKSGKNNMRNRRFIEESFPVKEVSRESAREKNNRSKEWNKGFIKKDKNFISVLGPQKRILEDLEGSSELLDVLHKSLLLWEKNKRDEMLELLSNYGKDESLFRVAQAISETLPNESKEKKLLDGFLVGRERLRDEIRKESEQRTLF